MNLFDLFVRIGVKDEASEKIKEFSESAKKYSEKIGHGFKTAAKVGVAATAAIGTAVGALTKKSVENYAEYEQLVGGVETLFKNSSNTVQKYAANAYKTAGLSANEYMETVTSFSASLLQSLGNDSEKAANYADKAITDMSDNANKMGTDMASIQNAYQGFAKQNYTMLDNLKLGYGGTKSEMERLIEDANKLKKANGEMANLTIDSYADIVEAIHTVQTEMGITGTTALEASTTIEGSINSTKAAWSNLVTGLADDNADIDELVNDFVESFSTAAKNILPRVGKALSGVGELITALAPEVKKAIPKLVKDVLPTLVKSTLEAVHAIAETILGSNAANTLTGAIKTIIYDLLPPLIDVISSLLTGLEPVLDTMIDIISVLARGLSKILENESVVDLIVQVGAGMLGAAVAIEVATVAMEIFNAVTAANPIGLLITTIGFAIGALISFKSEIKSTEEAQEDLSEAIEAFNSAQESYNESVNSEEEALKKLNEVQKENGILGVSLAEAVDRGTLSYKEMNSYQREVYDAYLDLQLAQKKVKEKEEELTKAKEEETKAFWENELAIASNTRKFDNLKKSVIKAYEQGTLSAEEASEILAKAFIDVSAGSRKTFLEDIPGDLSEGMMAVIGTTYTTAEIMGRGIRGWWIDDAKPALEEIPGWFSEKFEAAKNGVITAFAPVGEWFGELWEEIKEELSAVGAWFSEGFSEAKRGIVGAFDGIKEDMSRIWKKIKDAFDVSDALNWGKDMIENFKEGINQRIESLKRKVREVAQSVKNILGFSEPKEGPLSNFHTYAPDMMRLFAQGVRDNESIVTNQIKKSFDFDDYIKDFDDPDPLGFGTGGGSRGVHVTQNIYSEAKTAADLMQEVIYQQERAVVFGV